MLSQRATLAGSVLATSFRRRVDALAPRRQGSCHSARLSEVGRPLLRCRGGPLETRGCGGSTPAPASRSAPAIRRWRVPIGASSPGGAERAGAFHDGREVPTAGAEGRPRLRDWLPLFIPLPGKREDTTDTRTPSDTRTQGHRKPTLPTLGMQRKTPCRNHEVDGTRD